MTSSSDVFYCFFIDCTLYCDKLLFLFVLWCYWEAEGLLYQQSPSNKDLYCTLFMKQHLINKGQVRKELEWRGWRPNCTTYRKFDFNEFVANILRHFWPPRLWRLLEAKNIISRRTLWHFNSTFGSSHSASSAYQRFTKKWDQLWLSASIQPPYLEF